MQTRKQSLIETTTYEDPHKLMSFVCEMAAINVTFRNIYKGKNETQKM